MKKKKVFPKAEGKSWKKKQETNLPPKTIRLNKYIANAGICSRREADTLIAEGKIKVNDQIITELGYQVAIGDKVMYQGKVLRSEKLQYVLLNKPKDYITTLSDPSGRKTVVTLIKGACEERIYPVGRLDRHTTGLLLLTNDGELAKRLTHPSHQVKKIYQVTLNQPFTKADFDQLINHGVELEDGLAVPDELAIVSDDSKTLGIEIHIGRNRIVRRIFEHLGYRVTGLDRVMFGNLTKKNLPRGKWRHLSDKEIIQLKSFK